MPGTIDAFLPHPDVEECHEIPIDAPPELVFALACEMDLSDHWIIRKIFRAREIVMGAQATASGLPHGLVALTTHLGWRPLAETAGRELVMGALAQPWLADVVFHGLPAGEFRDFRDAGWVKIAWTLEAIPDGAVRTRLRTQTRVVATDEASRKRFRGYWRKFGIGIVLIRRLMLPRVRREAERRYRESITAMKEKKEPPMKRIAIIQGHPDPNERHFGHALAKAYSDGALAAGHEVKTIAIADLEFPLLRSQADWTKGSAPAAIAEAQETVRWAEHLVILYPLWLGDVPALLKAFLEQLLRPGFAFEYREGKTPKKLLAGRSARIVVTMGMPGFVYKWYFGAHSLKSLERNILGFVGIKPVHSTVIGGVEGDPDARAEWLDEMVKLGRDAH